MDFIESEVPKGYSYGIDGKKSTQVSISFYSKIILKKKMCQKDNMFKNYIQKNYYIGIVVFSPQKYRLGKKHTKLCMLNK